MPDTDSTSITQLIKELINSRFEFVLARSLGAGALNQPKYRQNKKGAPDTNNGVLRVEDAVATLASEQ